MSLVCAVLLCSNATTASKITPLNGDFHAIPVMNASVQAFILDFNLITNINVEHDCAELRKRLTELDGICKTPKITASTVELCKQHLETLSKEVISVENFIRSIPSSKSKRWVAPVAITAITIAGTVGTIAYVVSKDMERAQQIKELQEHSARMGKLLLNLTESEFSEVNKELETIISIQFDNQLKLMLLDYALKTQEFFEVIKLRYEVPRGTVPAVEFRKSLEKQKSKNKWILPPASDEKLLMLLPPSRIVIGNNLSFIFHIPMVEPTNFTQFVAITTRSEDGTAASLESKHWHQSIVADISTGYWFEPTTDVIEVSSTHRIFRKVVKRKASTCVSSIVLGTAPDLNNCDRIFRKPVSEIVQIDTERSIIINDEHQEIHIICENTLSSWSDHALVVDGAEKCSIKASSFEKAETSKKMLNGSEQLEFIDHQPKLQPTQEPDLGSGSQFRNLEVEIGDEIAKIEAVEVGTSWTNVFSRFITRAKATLIVGGGIVALIVVAVIYNRRQAAPTKKTNDTSSDASPDPVTVSNFSCFVNDEPSTGNASENIELEESAPNSNNQIWARPGRIRLHPVVLTTICIIALSISGTVDADDRPCENLSTMRLENDIKADPPALTPPSIVQPSDMKQSTNYAEVYAAVKAASARRARSASLDSYADGIPPRAPTPRDPVRRPNRVQKKVIINPVSDVMKKLFKMSRTKQPKGNFAPPPPPAPTRLEEKPKPPRSTPAVSAPRGTPAASKTHKTRGDGPGGKLFRRGRERRHPDGTHPAAQNNPARPTR